MARLNAGGAGGYTADSSQTETESTSDDSVSVSTDSTAHEQRQRAFERGEIDDETDPSSSVSGGASSDSDPMGGGGQDRQLRDDATSDPMREQTEPTPTPKTPKTGGGTGGSDFEPGGSVDSSTSGSGNGESVSVSGDTSAHEERQDAFESGSVSTSDDSTDAINTPTGSSNPFNRELTGGGNVAGGGEVGQTDGARLDDRYDVTPETEQERKIEAEIGPSQRTFTGEKSASEQVAEEQLEDISAGKKTTEQATEEMGQLGDELSGKQGIETGDSDIARQARELEQQVINEYDTVDETSDVRVTRDGDTLGVELTEGGELDVYTDVVAEEGKRVEADRQQRIEEEMSNAGARAEDLDDFKGEVAAEYEEQTGIDVDKSDVTLVKQDDGTYRAKVTKTEAFDYDWSFGMGDPEKDEVEAALSSASDKFRRAGDWAASSLFDEGGVASESIGDDVLRALGQDELADQYESGLRDFGKGVVQSSVMITDVPGVAKTGLEGTEAAGTLVTGVASGQSRETLGSVGERGFAIGESVYNYAKENKAGFAGMAAGGLAASYGIMSTAARIGPRAGAASRYAIQPGEELAGAAGFRATKAATSTATAQKLFPNKEPLIFSEEAAIRGGQKAATKIRNLEYQDAKTRAQPSRLQQEMTSARFKAEEMLRSDAPVSYSSDINTRYLDRGRQEMTSARFKAAETKARAGQKLQGAKSEMRTFIGSERGQAQLGKSRLRGSSDLETAETDLDGGMRRNLETETSSRLQTELESEIRTGTESRLRSGLETELKTETATRSEVRTQAKQETRLRTEPLIDTREVTDTRSRMDTRPMEMETLGFDTEVRTETGIESELAQDTETWIDTETRSNTDIRSEFALESELETEFELEAEAETRREVEQIAPELNRGGTDRRRRSTIESSTVLERDLINPFTGE